MSDKEKAMEGLKRLNIQPPTASTTVRGGTVNHTVGPARQDAVAMSPRRTDLFFRGHPVETPGLGVGVPIVVDFDAQAGNGGVGILLKYATTQRQYMQNQLETAGYVIPTSLIDGFLKRLTAARDAAKAKDSK